MSASPITENHAYFEAASEQKLTMHLDVVIPSCGLTGLHVVPKLFGAWL